jgi:hypothetical protein
MSHTQSLPPGVIVIGSEKFSPTEAGCPIPEILLPGKYRTGDGRRKEARTKKLDSKLEKRRILGGSGGLGEASRGLERFFCGKLLAPQRSIYPCNAGRHQYNPL